MNLFKKKQQKRPNHSEEIKKSHQEFRDWLKQTKEECDQEAKNNGNWLSEEPDLGNAERN